MQFPEINTVAGAQAAPMAHACYYVNLPSKIDEKDVTCELLCVDKDYFEVLQSKFINDFETETLNNFTSSDIIINQAGALALGIKNYSDESIDDYRIKAVVDDINYKTSTSKVPPRIYKVSTRAISSVLVRSEKGNVKVLYDNIVKQYKEVFPDFNPEVISYDDIIEKAYAEDIELKDILIIVLAVMFMLTVFGFFSIADYDFVKKAKGISVRRILGAKYFSLLVENIKNSLFIFLVSSLISVVLGFYLSKMWLANYYYKIDLNYSYFVGALMVGFLIIILNILIFIIKMIKLDTCKVLQED